MSLQVNDSNPDEFKMKQEKPAGPTKDGTYAKSMGGTELMNKALLERVDNLKILSSITYGR